MSKRHVSCVVSTLLLFLVSASTVFAQGSSGAISGRVVDESGGAVAGVIITLEDKRTGATRRVTTNLSGGFRAQLPPGVYELKSSKADYASVTIEEVVVNLGATSELTIPLKFSEVEEIVTYGSAQQLMPASTGETGLNISLEELTKLPVARNIESVALLAPGTVSGDLAFGDDKVLVSFGGASVAENVYYIDGLNVTNFRNGLGGSSVPFEFYEHFQIKTGGYGAEFGRSTGGVINAVTKRGSNEFEYGIVTFFEPDWMQGTSPNTIESDGDFYDYNASNEQTGFTTNVYIGGPIIRDRLFFYGLYEFRDVQSDFNSLGSPDIFNKQVVDDDFWGGNLTWNVTDNHSLSWTTFTDEREISTKQYAFNTDTGVQGGQTGLGTEFRGGENNIVRYDGTFGDNFSVSAMWGKNEYSLTDLSTNDVTCPLVVDVSAGATSFRPGCEVNALIQEGGDEREAYRIDLEWYLGNHTLRAGFDREDNASVDSGAYSGTSFTDLPGGVYYRYLTRDVGTTLPNGAVVPDVNGDGTPVELVRFRYIQNGGSFDTISQAWYIEDQWEVNDQFTVSLGLRNETFENNNAEGNTFIEIDDQWAPRVAFRWSPGGTGDQAVTLNWGRYHLPIAANTNVRLSGAELDFRRYFVHDGNRDATTAAPVAIDPVTGMPTTLEIGTQSTTSDGTVPDTSAIIDSTLDPMYQDEWILAYETQIGDNWVLGARYIYRELSSTIDDILVDFGLEEIGWDGPIGSGNDCHYVLTNPGTPVTTFCEQYIVPGDPGSGTQLVQTTIPADALGFPEAERTYEAIELTAEGTIGDWTLSGSYTYSRNEGNTEGYVKSDIGQDDAGITQDFDIPQLMDGALGDLPNDRRHKLKLFGSYNVSDRFVIGANFFLQSGRPINAFGEGHPDGPPDYGDTFYLTTDVGDPGVVGDETYRFVPRGTAGRTAWIAQLDLAAIYSFNWNDRADIELRAEIFNVLDGDSAREVYEFPETKPERYRLPSHMQRPRYFRLGAAIRF